MPFVSNMDNDEQKTDPTITPQGAVSPVGGGAAVRLSPSSAVAPAGGGGSGTPGSAPTPAAGGQFASLDKYITANQGQAAPLAGKLTPGINQEYNALDTANNAAISSINNQVTNAPGYTPNNPDVLAAEAANPASFTSDPNNVKQFQSLLQNTYSGPASAEGTNDYANQQSAINQAIAKGTTQTTTEAGRKDLLSQNEATPTANVTALNSAILSQDPNALASIEGAYKPFQNLMTNLNTGAQGVNQTISKEQSDAASSSKAANDAINSQIAALNTGVSGALTAAQQKAAAQNASVKSALGNLYGGQAVDTAPQSVRAYDKYVDLANATPYKVGQLSPDQLQSLGMTQDQWNALQGSMAQAGAGNWTTPTAAGLFTPTAQLDLQQFLTQQDPNATISAANVATPAEYAKAQAFQTLLQGMNLNAPTTLINPATAGQAGTAPTNLNSFDYASALTGAQGLTQAEKDAALQESQSINNYANSQSAASQNSGGMFGSLSNFFNAAKPWIANPYLQLGKTTLQGAQKVLK